MKFDCDINSVLYRLDNLTLQAPKCWERGQDMLEWWESLGHEKPSWMWAVYRKYTNDTGEWKELMLLTESREQVDTFEENLFSMGFSDDNIVLTKLWTGNDIPPKTKFKILDFVPMDNKSDAYVTMEYVRRMAYESVRIPADAISVNPFIYHPLV